MEETQSLISDFNFNVSCSDAVRIEYFRFNAAASKSAEAIRLRAQGFSESALVSILAVFY